MRKIINIILLALGAAAAMYSLIAAMLTRGLGAYRLGTKLGAVLAGSWQYTAVAAVALIAVAVIPWLLTLDKKKQAVAAPAAAPEAASVPDAPKKKLFGGLKNKLADAVQNIPTVAQEAPAPAARPVYQQPVQQPVYQQPVQQPVMQQPAETVPVAAEQPVRAFCPMCGAAVTPGGKFCAACGAQLGGNE